MMYVALMAYEFGDEEEPGAETKRVYVNPMSISTFGPYAANRPDLTIISFAGSDDVMFVAGTPEKIEQLLTSTARYN